MPYVPKTYRTDGGDKIVIASGGTIHTEDSANVTTAKGVGAKYGRTVSVVEYGTGDLLHKTVLTLTAATVTISKNSTSSGGGGVKIYDFPAGAIYCIGATSNLTIANATDGSWLGSLGSAAADNTGTLTSTEITFAPQTSATISSGVGTLKLQTTALAPVVGAPIDGTSTAADLYLNFCLNSDVGTGTTMTVSGTITIVWINLGDY